MPSRGSSDDAARRHSLKHVFVYQEQSKRNLCNKEEQMVSSNVYVTLFRGLSLNEYIQARTLNCQRVDSQPCLKCNKMLYVASNVLRDGFVVLSTSFKEVFPTHMYKCDVAILRFLQMPLAAIRIGTPLSGLAK